jgi:hypothetical protein
MTFAMSSSACAYLNDPKYGATLSTIMGGHTLDLAISILGKIVEIDVLASIHFPSIHLIDTDKQIERLTPDQLLILSRHANGFQGGKLSLEGDITFTSPNAPVGSELPCEALNVAEVYTQLGNDIRNSTWNVTDFDHAFRLTRLIS